MPRNSGLVGFVSQDLVRSDDKPATYLTAPGFDPVLVRGLTSSGRLAARNAQVRADGRQDELTLAPALQPLQFVQGTVILPLDDAMLVKVQRRFSKGFSVLNSFTWSKTFDDTGFWGPQISGYVLEHRLQSEDRPFHLSIAPTWDLPFGRQRWLGANMPKALDLIAGGWELTGTFTIQSGTPVQFNTDSFFSGKDFHISRDNRSLDKWFDTTAFMPFPAKNVCLQGNPYCDPSQIVNYPAWTGIQNLPGFNYYGVAPGLANSDYKQIADPNNPANMIWVCKSVCNGVYQDFATFVRRYPTRFGDVRNPRVNEVNLGLFKNFQATEHVRLQYRFEVFNAFNHARFGGPNTDPSNSLFGSIAKVQQNQARQVQMALKILF